jgi:triacylglycerol esterase/lipase EstA (alpha/beta hydrolase family)
MGAVFTNSPNEPATVAVRDAKIFDAPCKFCRDGRRATTSIRPVDYIGHPMGDLDVCSAQAERLIERARSKGLAVSIRE